MFIVNAQVTGAETERAADELISLLQSRLCGMMPKAAIAFIGSRFDETVLVVKLEAAFPGIAVVGTTVSGMYADEFGFGEDCLQATVIGGEGVDATALFESERAEKGSLSSQIAEKYAASAQPPGLAISLIASSARNKLQIIESIERVLENRCPLVGAVAGRTAADRAETRVFGGSDSGRPIASLLILSGPFEVVVKTGRSWEPVGVVSLVNEAEGNTVKKIDGMPALDYFQLHLGEHRKPAPEFPLAVFDTKPDTEFRLHPTTRYDFDTRFVDTSPPIPTGSIVRISEATQDHIIQQAVMCAEQFRLGPARPEMVGVLCFSCNIRKGMLGTGAGLELDALRNVLGNDVPVAGLFGFGEIGPSLSAGKCALFGATLVAVAIYSNDCRSTSRKSVGVQAPVRAVTDSDALNRIRLERANYYRADLEQIQRTQAALLRSVNRRVESLNRALIDEKQKSETLLLNILPEEIAGRLKDKSATIADRFENVTVLFSDIVGFTRLSQGVPPEELVGLLNEIVFRFDQICKEEGVEKIKTIGDAYMAAAGVPVPAEDHAVRATQVALRMLEVVRGLPKVPERSIDIRIGLHSGPVVAGVIGRHKYAYDLWGDTVNTAARMESHGAPGRIQVSATTHSLIKHRFSMEPAGAKEIKGKGMMTTYMVNGEL